MEAGSAVVVQGLAVVVQALVVVVQALVATREWMAEVRLDGRHVVPTNRAKGPRFRNEPVAGSR
ncbi:MAG: hypothetical protein KGS10_12620 [Chloroflexi bacterium]|nr:hypothetical protein [Chloroflexota bacterium]